jgi:hypothetical protein
MPERTPPAHPASSGGGHGTACAESACWRFQVAKDGARGPLLPHPLLSGDVREAERRVGKSTESVCLFSAKNPRSLIRITHLFVLEPFIHFRGPGTNKQKVGRKVTPANSTNKRQQYNRQLTTDGHCGHLTHTKSLKKESTGHLRLVLLFLFVLLSDSSVWARGRTQGPH